MVLFKYKWFRYVAVSFLLTGTIFFLFRNIILHQAISYLSERINKKYDAELTINNAHFIGLSTIQATNLLLVSSSHDTLAFIDSIRTKPSFISILLFHPRATSLIASNGFVTLQRNSNARKRETKSETQNYSDYLSKLLSGLFDLTPSTLQLSNINLRYKTDSVDSWLSVARFNLENENVDGIFADTIASYEWKMTGTFKQADRQLQLKIIPMLPATDERRNSISMLQSLFHFTVAFNTLDISLQQLKQNRLTLKGNISSSGLSIYHPKISDDTVVTDHFSFDYNVQAQNNSIQLDSLSLISLNDLSIHPFFNLETKTQGDGDTEKKYSLSLQTEAVSSTNFFHSLPSGMFDETRDIKADGTLQYSLYFKLDSAQPDSLEFSSELKKNMFRLRELGRENFYKINDEFQYTVYEHDHPFRTFLVGPSNPEYAPLDKISPYLRNAILTSEDGSFFFHNGFNEDAFRKSIAENYKKEGFARGGSTITMQLVKNIFLSRHKTIARKAEEALITWLIESNHLCSKERMFEVYLNIIELGPGVYGVGEASRFYFNKKPSDLTLSESIFIASLLPHPKWFKYSFDEQGNLKPYLAAYYKVVSNFLLRKNLITQQEYDAIEPNVKLQGPARNIVVPTDTIPPEVKEELIDN